MPTLEYVADNIATMEKRPFEGVIFKLSGGNDVFAPQADPADQFQKDMTVAPRIEWDAFTDNFVLLLSASEQDWFSDEHWEHIIRRAAQMARVARLAQCVGVCFDPEPYGPNPWSHVTALHKDEKTFAEYQTMARVRGAQFIRAIESELPAPKVLALFFKHGVWGFAGTHAGKSAPRTTRRRGRRKFSCPGRLSRFPAFLRDFGFV